MTDWIFETERLGVRKLELADFDAFHEMQSDPVVMQFTTGEGFDANENRRQLEDCIARYQHPGNDFWVWAILEKAKQQFIGTCAIVPNDNRPEIGYRLLRASFGNGYGQEICDGLIEYGIHQQHLSEIIAYVDIRNVASVKILDRSRLNFVKEMEGENGIIDRFYRWSRS